MARTKPARGSRSRPQPGALTSASSPIATPARLGDVALSAGLIAATLLAYQPAWHGALLWDDRGHLTLPALQSLEGLFRIWFSVGATQQYYPVVHTAFWLQHWFWGDGTLGYHLTNIAIHAGAACLFALVLRRLQAPGAFLAALVFALHPVHVESVAWISELKNTLSGCFFLAAALAYVRFDDTRSRLAYAGALVAFALAGLSKSVTVTLPAGLLVLLWWRRGRLDWRRDVLPLAPFVVVALPIVAVTVWFEQNLIGARSGAEGLSLVERLLVAGRAVWFYLSKLVWPATLTFHYPRWSIDASVWWQYLYPLGVLAALAGGWIIRHRTRAPLAVGLFFLVTLAPALGFVDAYPFRFSFVADHFQYLASLGPIALVSGGLTLAASRRFHLSPARSSSWLACGLAVPLFMATHAQSQDYHDEETLWRRTIARSPDGWAARNNLATLLLSGGPARAAEALTHARRATELNRSDPASHYNLGAALELSGDSAAAIASYRTALDLMTASTGGLTGVLTASLHHRLGRVLAASGRTEEAVAEYQRGLALDKASAPMQADLGVALGQLGRLDEALAALDASIALDHARAGTYNDRGGILLRSSRYADAVAALEEALRRDPGLTDARYNLGLAFLQLGRFEEAAREFGAVVAVGPTVVGAHRYLAGSLFALGRTDAAVAHLRQVTRAGLSAPELYRELGRMLIAIGRTAEGEAELSTAASLERARGGG